MQKKTKDNHFIKKPIYPGGLKAMRDLIRQELKYPDAALKAKIEGTVSLRYEIDHKGKVLSSKVISGIGHGCDEEAQRIVSLFQFSVPKNPRKLKLKFHKTIKIHFRLPKEKETQKPTKKTENNVPPATISYTITPASKKDDNNDRNGAYTYTISY